MTDGKNSPDGGNNWDTNFGPAAKDAISQELELYINENAPIWEKEEEDFVRALAKYKLEQYLSEHGEFFNEDNQISSFDLPCLTMFRQEEDGLIHRLLLFNHKEKTSLVDLAYYEEDKRPIPQRNITLDLISPEKETPEETVFVVPLILSKKDFIKVTHNKKTDKLLVEDSPSTTIDENAIKYAEDKLKADDER